LNQLIALISLSVGRSAAQAESVVMGVNKTLKHADNLRASLNVIEAVLD